MEILEDTSYWFPYGWTGAVLIAVCIIVAICCAGIYRSSSKIRLALSIVSVTCMVFWMFTMIFGWFGTSYRQERYVVRINDETTANEFLEKWEVGKKYDHTNIYEVKPREDKK